MSAQERKITKPDIAPFDVYARERAERKRALVAVKKPRRLEVGPFATFYFENYETMLGQVQEMLHIEKGGEEQIPGELEAYNPLIPQGDELRHCHLINRILTSVNTNCQQRTYGSQIYLGHLEFKNPPHGHFIYFGLRIEPHLPSLLREAHPPIRYEGDNLPVGGLDDPLEVWNYSVGFGH